MSEPPYSYYSRSIFWRETMRTPRLAIFDWRLLCFVGIFLLHIRLWTLAVLVVALIGFWLLERYGLRFPSALLMVRAWFAGPERSPITDARRRRWISYGFEGANGGVFDFVDQKERPSRLQFRGLAHPPGGSSDGSSGESPGGGLGASGETPTVIESGAN